MVSARPVVATLALPRAPVPPEAAPQGRGGFRSGVWCGEGRRRGPGRDGRRRGLCKPPGARCAPRATALTRRPARLGRPGRVARRAAGDEHADTDRYEYLGQYVRELLPPGPPGYLGLGPGRHAERGRRHDARRVGPVDLVLGGGRCRRGDVDRAGFVGGPLPGPESRTEVGEAGVVDACPAWAAELVPVGVDGAGAVCCHTGYRGWLRRRGCMSGWTLTSGSSR